MTRIAMICSLFLSRESQVKEVGESKKLGNRARGCKLSGSKKLELG
jgi:hypothetical protein